MSRIDERMRALDIVFGERGIHARSAVSLAQVPFGACVEIDMIAELTAIQVGGSI
jgi:enamine deaminase RidA (YjgF/YER057c/UK114 family)